MKNLKRVLLASTAAVAAVVSAVLVPASAQALGQYPTGGTGVDLSYPSCSAPVAKDAAFGIVGVSGGRVFTDNACAAAEASHFRNVSIYVNTGLYTGGAAFARAMTYGGCASRDRSCGAYWYGYLAGVRAYD
jgi:hypothetical protein